MESDARYVMSNKCLIGFTVSLGSAKVQSMSSMPDHPGSVCWPLHQGESDGLLINRILISEKASSHQY